MLKIWVARIKVFHYQLKHHVPKSVSNCLLTFSLSAMLCTLIALQQLLCVVNRFLDGFPWFLLLENQNALQCLINSLVWFLRAGSPASPLSSFLGNVPALPLCTTNKTVICHFQTLCLTPDFYIALYVVNKKFSNLILQRTKDFTYFLIIYFLAVS